MDKVKLNALLRNTFLENKNEVNLEAYIMSEISSPYEDYENAVHILSDNLDIINDKKLLFIGSYLSSYCFIRDNIFLQTLNKNIENYSDANKSIIYYLNAIHIASITNNRETDKNYIDYLKKSVALSSEIKFVNNRRYLAIVSNKKIALKLIEQALNNIVKVYSESELIAEKDTSLPNSENFINEFILGTHITHVIFDDLKEKLEKYK